MITSRMSCNNVSGCFQRPLSEKKMFMSDGVNVVNSTSRSTSCPTTTTCSCSLRFIVAVRKISVSASFSAMIALIPSRCSVDTK